MITEAAIFLPVFILSVLTLSFLIKAVWIQISVFEALTDEARKSSVKAYVFENISDHLPQQLQGFAADASDRWIFLRPSVPAWKTGAGWELSSDKELSSNRYKTAILVKQI